MGTLNSQLVQLPTMSHELHSKLSGSLYPSCCTSATGKQGCHFSLHVISYKSKHFN
jgi:hypothetical protein